MSRSKAFTLLELLVALALTSVLAVLLVSIVSATLNIWQQGRNQIDTFSNARQLLGRMTDELKGAIASNQVQFIENSLSIKGTTDPILRTSENVFFVAPYPNSAPGDLCVIAYRHNSDTHELQRAFVESQGAWNGGATNRYQVTGYAPATLNWRTIATGVLEFELRAYSQQNLDNDTTIPNLPASWDSTGATDATMTANVPRRIVLRMKVIDDKALVRLNALPATGAAHDRIINQSAREFTADLSLLPPH